MSLLHDLICIPDRSNLYLYEMKIAKLSNQSRRQHAPHPRTGPWKWKHLNSSNSKNDWLMSPGDIIQRTCVKCAETHKTIVYKRLTGPGEIDFKKLFLQDFREYPSGGKNELNKHFALYSSVADAKVLTI